MFVLGHVGLTWGGSMVLLESVHRLVRLGRSEREKGAPVDDSWPAHVDYRLVILGSMVPDLIDKPVGIFILGDQLGNGRVYGHSLAFLLLLLLAALVWRGRIGGSLTQVALGSAAHLAMDRMWREPVTLLWPLRGWALERQDVSGWVGQMVEQMFSDPYTYVSEALGAMVIAALLGFLVTRRGLPEFIRTGRTLPRPRALKAVRLTAGEESSQQLQGGERPAER